MFLFFDSETTGLVKWKEPNGSDCQPHLVSLGAIQMSEDEQEINTLYAIIKPDGFVIPPESTKCHGITHEYAMAYGLPLKSVLRMFAWFCAQASQQIAYNSDFDFRAIAGEHLRLGIPNFLKPERLCCVMRAMTPVVALPPNPGYTDCKWPSLQESYKFMFGQDFQGAHNAMSDARATSHLAFALREQGLWTPSL